MLICDLLISQMRSTKEHIKSTTFACSGGENWRHSGGVRNVSGVYFRKENFYLRVERGEEILEGKILDNIPL